MNRITLGNWQQSPKCDAVVSNAVDSDTDVSKYYGGQLIAESIGNAEDRKLIILSKQIAIEATLVEKKSIAMIWNPFEA